MGFCAGIIVIFTTTGCCCIGITFLGFRSLIKDRESFFFPICGVTHTNISTTGLLPSLARPFFFSFVFIFFCFLWPLFPHSYHPPLSFRPLSSHPLFLNCLLKTLTTHQPWRINIYIYIWIYVRCDYLPLYFI